MQLGWGERQGTWGEQSRFEMKLNENEEDCFSRLIKAKAKVESTKMKIESNTMIKQETYL
jgi:hypothetical protein